MPPSRENSQSSYKHLKPGVAGTSGGSNHTDMIINQSSVSHMSASGNSGQASSALQGSTNSVNVASGEGGANGTTKVDETIL